MSKHKKQAETLPVNPSGNARKSITDVNLANIRESVMASRIDISRTIADLEEWREEIDVTIAFLRAQRRS